MAILLQWLSLLRPIAYVQRESPGKDKEENWLPAPADEFVLTMRMYWPKESPPSIIDGTWKPPSVKEGS